MRSDSVSHRTTRPDSPVGRVAAAWAVAAAVALVAAGCSAEQARRGADKAAARILKEKSGKVRNMDPKFTIEPAPVLDLAKLPVAPEPPDFLGTDGAIEKQARVLDLETAMEVAVRQSRDYQARKELLYLDSLDLSLTRHNYTPIFSTTAGGTLEESSAETRAGKDPITGEDKTAVRNASRLVTGRLTMGAGWLLATGARLTTDFSTSFFRYLSGGAINAAQNDRSSLGARITQPLLRGAGYKATMENLTQAERSLLYSLRDFAQYRQDFAVQTASAYYGVLAARDAARNSHLDLQRQRQNVSRERAFTSEGQRPLAALDQLRQAELASETRWSESIRAYFEALDRFKITLGISVSTPLVLADQDLANLKILETGVPLPEAMEVAQKFRLDLLTSRERTEDSRRKVPIEKLNLLPQIDATAGASFSDNTERGFAVPTPRNYQWDAGLNIDLGLDRTARRNAYRRVLIAAARAQREQALAEDNVRLQIATDWRALEQARRNFTNAELAVTLAERRVEEQTLRMELGRGQPRDLLDAQSDLNTARNGRTTAVVAHTLARLRYWRDMGLLWIRDDGGWETPAPDATAPNQATAPTVVPPPPSSTSSAVKP